jgi:hypothetical protein
MSSTPRGGTARGGIKDRLKPDTTIKVSFGGSGEESPRFIIAYWSIRGLGAPLRMMLSAAQVNHWVVLYDVIEEGESGWSNASYLADKKWLKDEFNALMNLPFLVDVENDRVICQTNAIFLFLGRELNFMGSSKQEQCKCEEILCELMDLRDAMVDFAYDTDSSKEKAINCYDSATNHLHKLELHLEREYKSSKMDACHLVGFKFTAPDFHFFELLDQYRGLCKTYDLPLIFRDMPYVSQFFDCFQKLPENKAYLSSFLAMDLPYNNPYAKFGSDSKTLGQYVRGQNSSWLSKGVCYQSTE